MGLLVGSIPGILLGGAVDAYGQMYQGHAAAAAAQENQQIDLANAAVAHQNANITAQAGEAQTGISQQKTRAIYGSTVVNKAAGNVDVHQGSSVGVGASERGLGMMDALTIRSEAIKHAYGFQQEEASQRAEAALEGQEAKYDIEGGNIQATGTMIGSLNTAGNQFAEFMMNGGGGSIGGG